MFTPEIRAWPHIYLTIAFYRGKRNMHVQVFYRKVKVKIVDYAVV